MRKQTPFNDCLVTPASIPPKKALTTLWVPRSGPDAMYPLLSRRGTYRRAAADFVGDIPCSYAGRTTSNSSPSPL